MKRRHGAACAVLVCLFVCGGNVRTSAQENGGRSFFSTLSYDAYFGGMYDWYHGNSMGARIALPLLRIPALNALSSAGDEASEDLLLIPGVKFGSIKGGTDPLPVRVMYFAPDLSLHYTFLRFSGFSFLAGPSLEYIFTNNWRKYTAVPAGGLDLGMMFRVSPHVQIGLEQRWIMVERKSDVMNAADFPQKPFSHLGLVLRFSLPWKAEEAGRAALRSEYEQSRTETGADEQAQQRTRNWEADSLRAKVRALEAKLEQANKHPAAAERAPVDRFNAGAVVGDPEYVFTRDPFKAGNLVNDGYLKNVLIDILDDDYVWQLRAKKNRMHDAEKIRAYFTLYNKALDRRIVLVEDESVRLFTLKCLGKALVLGTE